ncbi:MAG: helix-turn-helix domain-containing protein [Candidatus Peribacteraceae bacterium]|nr:helix-turn-helix domain-containing protein [Candidatus Peribacteraceae bacterium]
MIKQTLPSVEELTNLIDDAMAGGCHPSVVQRLSVLRYFVQYRPTVLELCRHFGISRSTFHRWIERFDPTDILSLMDRSQDAHGDTPSTVSSEAVDLIRRYRQEAPLLGKERIASFLRQQHGIVISASTVGRVIDRECLYFAETPLHWKKRIEHGTGEYILPPDLSAVTPPIHPSQPPSQPVALVTEPLLPSQPAGPIVHVHVPDAGASRVVFSGFAKFIVLTSLLINIVFIAMLFGMALFESSTRSAGPRMDAATMPTDGQSIQKLHGAPSTVFFPE